MRLLSPEGRPVPVKVTLAARPTSLAGVRVGFLDNTKAPVDQMMAHLAKRFRERHPDLNTFYVSKAHPSRPAEPAVFAALRNNADIVVNALGD